MKKNIKIISILVVSLLLTLSCGFKPVNFKDNQIIYMRNVNVSGDQKISYSLKNNILLISDKNSENKYDVEIKLDKTDKAKIKDNKGKVTRYNISISANLKLSNVEDNNEIQRVFLRNGDFDVASSHSDTINNEKNTTKNIIQQLSDDIISFITLAMRN